MAKKHLLLTLFLAPCLGLLSQTLNEYIKQHEAGLNAMKEEQQQFVQKMQKQFDDYVKQKDKEFAEYLAENWKAYPVFKGIEPPQKPKPPVIPKHETSPTFKPASRRISTIETKPLIEDIKPRKYISPRICKTDDKIYDKTGVTFNFFGLNIFLDYDQQLKIQPPATINPASISNYWEQLSNTNYSGLINQLGTYKDKMNLNDWAYYKLVNMLSKTINTQCKQLLNWFILSRSGYNVKLAYTNNNISLLLPSNFTIYSKYYLTIDNIKYYLMSNIQSDDLLFTYEKSYTGSDKLIDFSINSPFNFEKNITGKPLNFNYNKKGYSLNIMYNQNLIDFYREYPQVNINIYFNAAVSSETKETLIENLRPLVSGMSQQEAVRFLLKLVQSSFGYKTDQQQFNKEKFFFPEEILHYPFSDCEDRSVFFAFLVNELLNVKVIGLEYSDHIATAINFTENIEGENDYVMYENEKYIIADPTYHNAPLGDIMPKYRSVKAKIIQLSNNRKTGKNKKTFWELAKKSGGHKGNNLNDIAFDKNGNAYVTGYFTSGAKFGNYPLHAGPDAEKRCMFVASYNKNGKVNWAKKISGSSHSTGFSILFHNDNIYVAGWFNGSIQPESPFANLHCKKGTDDVFVAKYNLSGNMLWINKTGLDGYPRQNQLAYLAKFNAKGDNLPVHILDNAQQFEHTGLQAGPMNMIYLLGTFNNTTGFAISKEELIINEEGFFDLLESLKAESDRLVKSDYEKHIAGLFSVVNHIKYSGVKITGSHAQTALDKYNPSFKSKYPSVYIAIQKINFMLNQDGIITLQTINNKPLTINKLKIRNNAKIKINTYPGGDAHIDILSGISAGKLMIWYDLNYVKLYKKSGDLLFDYDTDHTQLVLNMKKDILE